MTTANPAVTPAGTITIYVEYRNSMSYENGTYYDDGRAANSIRAYNNLGAEGTWVNKDYFYRTSGGAANDEIIKRNDVTYNANDPTYGQKNLGCFLYKLDSVRDAAIISAYGDGSGAAAAAAMMKQAIAEDESGVYAGETIAWSNTSWSLGHTIKTPSRLVYVHLADRWGNVFNKIIKINNVDPVNPAAADMTAGSVTVNEAGGSGISLVRIYEYAYEGSPSFVAPCWSDKLIEEINVINEPDNVLDLQVTITDTTRFTLYALDKAGNAVTRTVNTDAAGNLAVTINDPENMGGPGGNAGAKAMAGQAYTFLLNDSITVNLNTGGEAASYDITFKAGDHGTIGGAAETTVTLNENAPIEAPEVTAEAGWVFTGWSPELPLSATESGAYTAQYAKTEIGLTKLESGMKVFIKGWREDYRYQIWSWQEITSDALLGAQTGVTASQWVLSMAYAAGSEGALEADGSISYVIDNFTSPETNCTVSVRVVDENGNYVTEITDSYTPAEVNEAKITKVLADGEYAEGTVLKALESGSVTIKIVGNLEGLTYTAAVVNPETALMGNGNEFTWDISALSAGVYTVRLAASNAQTSDTRHLVFRLYSTDPGGYAVIDELVVTQDAGTMTVAPEFSNGEFRYIVREPGREPLYTSESYGSVSAPLAYETPGYGIYHIYGLVGGTGLADYEDGVIKTLNITRGGSKAAVALTADRDIGEGVRKGTAMRFTAEGDIAGDNIEYSFWRHDARGYALVKDWSADNTLEWTPARIGGYTIEVRAKAAGAGSYEAAKSVTVNVTDEAETKAEGVAITLNEAELNAEAKARLPVTVKANATSANSDELLYKFMVYDDDMLTSTLQNYSADQHCVWVPREAGTYKISVLVKNKASFGRYDAIESFTVMVE